MAIVELNRDGPVVREIEEAVKASFPRGTVLRAQRLTEREAYGLAALPPEPLTLVLINTQRTYGHFGVLEWNETAGVLHTGHYFDSLSEVTVDFNSRGGDLSM